MHAPSSLPLILVNGSRESRSSSTTSVRESNAGNILVNLAMWPGYHDGGEGRRGNGICGNNIVQ